MAATSRTLSYNAELTLTGDKIHKSGAIQDAVTNSNATFSYMMEKGRIKKKVVGGDQIRVGLMYEQNGTIDSYSGFDQIDVTPQDGITTMYVPWAQYGGAVSISGIQKFKNMGKERLGDLLKEKMAQTTAGWAERLNRDLWEGDSTNFSASHPFTGNGGKNIISIPLYIQALAAASAGHDYDIGNIDQSAETWWKNLVTDGAALATKALLKSTMNKAYMNASEGPGGYPDLIMMDPVTYGLYEESMQDQIQYKFTDKASAGFEKMAYKNATVMWDGYVPDYEAGTNGRIRTGSELTKGSIVFMNTNTFTLYVGKDHDWKPRGFQTPVDQDASTSLYLAYLQLVCDNRKKNNVIFDIAVALTG